MRDPEEPTIQAGLLDFYSDRATAHASFVVAAIFGIYTVFTISSSQRIVLFLSFPFLLLFEAYSFMNFHYYALKAHVVRNMLPGPHLAECNRQITDGYRRRSHRALAWFESLKITMGEIQPWLVFWWFFAFVVVAQVLPCIAILWSPIRATAFFLFINIERLHVVLIIAAISVSIPLIFTIQAFVQRRRESRRRKRQKTAE